MTSAAEAEIGVMCVNSHEAVPQRIALIEMEHPQPRAPMHPNNLTAHSVVTSKFQQRRTKAM